MNTNRIRLSRLAAALVLLGGVVLAPLAAADARPGGGSSMGSRGSRSYSMPAPTRTAPTSASPFDRSAAPRAAPYGSQTPYGGGSAMAGRGHPLAAGLLGGFLGASMAGMIFGHGGGYGAGYGGGFGLFGLLGLLIKLALIFFVLRWLYRRFFSASARTATAGGGMFGGFGQPAGGMQAGGGWAQPSAPKLAITQADYGQFEQILRDIQATWSRSDLGGLQRLTTQEMAAYFNEQLQELARRGARNAVSNVRLERGDLSEAWSESGRDYATVAMRYSMIDVTTDASGRVIDGSPSERVTVTELWTFVRRSGDASWSLSAIQQAR